MLSNGDVVLIFQVIKKSDKENKSRECIDKGLRQDFWSRMEA